jgi:hypothetical protein
VTPNQAYELLQKVEREFRSADDISSARKLIQTAFKDALNMTLVKDGFFTDDCQESSTEAQQ